MGLGQRDIYLNHLYEMLADPAMVIPDRADKIEICITGKYEGCCVFDRGNAVLPNETLCNALEEAIGQDRWLQIETQARVHSADWTYRCSCKYASGIRCSLAN